jgi:hypothetical protein
VTPSDLIGAAGAASIRQRLSAIGDGEGVARYLLDRLTGEQVAAITSALLVDPQTDALLKIQLPRTPSRTRGLSRSGMPNVTGPRFSWPTPTTIRAPRSAT